MEKATTRRIELDVLRGFAVLGIYWVNIIYFGWPYEANLYPTLFGGSQQLNIVSWGFIHLAVEGAMFALFSMLFGASAMMLLDARRLSAPDGLQAVEYYYRRNLWLIAFGLLHAFLLLWPFEILFSYGVLGLFLFPLRTLRPVTLLLIGMLLVSWGTNPLRLLAPSPQSEQAEEHHGYTATAPLGQDELVNALQEQLDDMAAESVLYHSGYLDIFLVNVGIAAGQQSTNLYEDNLWDAGGMMLIGMALFKWGVLSGQRSLLFYLVMTVLGFGSAILLRLPMVSTVIASGFDPEQMPLLASTPHLIARLPLALGYVGLILLLCRWHALHPLHKALAATGRLAFTHYVAQTLFSIFLFYGFGLNLFGELPYYQLILIAALFGAGQLLLSIAWLSYFQQGPLEWLWRALVHRKLPPFRRSSQSAVPVA